MRILLALLVAGLAGFAPVVDAALVYAEGLYVRGYVAKDSGYHWVFVTTDPGFGSEPYDFPAAPGCTNKSRGVIIVSPGNPGGADVYQAAREARGGTFPVSILYDTACVEWEPGSGVFAPRIRAIYR